jgi:hypothetical protein
MKIIVVAALALAALALLLGACTTAVIKPGTPVLPAAPFVTKETGQVTLSREEAVTILAQTQVLYRAWRRDAQLMCTAKLRSGEWCARLPKVDEEMKVLSMQAEARINHPEARLDYEHIGQILSLLAKLVL